VSHFPNKSGKSGTRSVPRWRCYFCHFLNNWTPLYSVQNVQHVQLFSLKLEKTVHRRFTHRPVSDLSDSWQMRHENNTAY